MRHLIASSHTITNPRLFTHIPRLSHLNRSFHSSRPRSSPRRQPHSLDPRLADLGKVIRDEYAVIREGYASPKHPIVLAHGLFGFDELRLAGPYLPGVKYWRGIREALEMKGMKVITATVPPSGSIEARAEELARDIAIGAGGKDVNIIAGLDARCMISHVKPKDFKVLSLTTIATPHRGSAIADYIFEQIGGRLKVETAAFAQLTRKYMQETFNPVTPDDKDVRYVLS
ncbi:Triacylglycerol lipase [Aspergillus sclerotialis]|uniref:Triacylglycerol lipase n=1 Tax=Aspergillus sclerotialis TaxID=2070753 RepID=A0A3A3A788_9EURO|nr:Triacylglycerol lipase [Aspergillus sclerotialis]